MTATVEDRVRVLRERLAALDCANWTRVEADSHDQPYYVKHNSYTGRIRIKVRDDRDKLHQFYVNKDADVATFDLAPVVGLVLDIRATRAARLAREQEREAARATEREFLSTLPTLPDGCHVRATGRGFELTLSELTAEQLTRCLVAFKERRMR